MKIFSKDLLLLAGVKAEDVAQVACSDSATWYLTKLGELYGCGYNNYGQQGSGSTTSVTTFTKRADNVAQIACSSATTWYLTKSGELYGCGYNDYGQQGSGSTTTVTTFTKRADNVAQVACFLLTTWYLTKSGELYGCGSNSRGQQGSGYTTTDVSWSQPTLSSDGTLGSGELAVSPTSVYSSNYGWKAFDKSSSTQWLSAAQNNNSLPQSITIYTSKPIKISYITVNNRLTHSNTYPTAGYIYGGSTSSPATSLKYFTNSTSGAGSSWGISLSGNNNYFNYHKISFTSASFQSSTSNFGVSEISISAVYQTTALVDVKTFTKRDMPNAA